MDAQDIKELEAAYYRGEFGRVVYEASQLLKNSACVPFRPAILFWKGTALLQSGQNWYGEAITCLREGIALAKQERPLKARLIAALGKVYADAGDPASYAPLVQEYDRLAKGRDQDVLRWGTYVWHNYGTALYNACQWADAANAFSRAAELAHQFGLSDLEGRALHDLSGAELYQGNLAKAAQAMSLAFPLFPDEVWGHKKTSRLAEYLYESGALDEALQKAEQAMTHPLADDSTRADVSYTLSRTLLALGRRSEAREKALIGLDFAVKAVFYPGIHKITLLLQQIGSQPRTS